MELLVKAQLSVMLSAPVCHLSVSHQIQAVRRKYCVHNCKLTHFQNRIFKITMSTASLPLCTHLHKSSRQRPTRLGYIYALEHDQELSIGIQVLSKTAMEGLRTQLLASPRYSLWNPTAGESCGKEQKSRTESFGGQRQKTLRHYSSFKMQMNLPSRK